MTSAVPVSDASRLPQVKVPLSPPVHDSALAELHGRLKRLEANQIDELKSATRIQHQLTQTIHQQLADLGELEARCQQADEQASKLELAEETAAKHQVEFQQLESSFGELESQLQQQQAEWKKTANQSEEEIKTLREQLEQAERKFKTCLSELETSCEEHAEEKARLGIQLAAVQKRKLHLEEDVRGLHDRIQQQTVAHAKKIEELHQSFHLQCVQTESRFAGEAAQFHDQIDAQSIIIADLHAMMKTLESQLRDSSANYTSESLKVHQHYAAKIQALEAGLAIASQDSEQSSQLAATVEQQAATIADLENQLAKQNQQISSQSVQIEQQQHTIDQQSSKLARQSTDLDSQSRELTDVKQQLVSLDSKYQAQSQQLEHAQLAADAADHDAMQQTDLIRVLELQLADRDALATGNDRHLVEVQALTDSLEAAARDAAEKADLVELLQTEIDELSAQWRSSSRTVDHQKQQLAEAANAKIVAEAQLTQMTHSHRQQIADCQQQIDSQQLRILQLDAYHAETDKQLIKVENEKQWLIAQATAAVEAMESRLSSLESTVEAKHQQQDESQEIQSIPMSTPQDHAETNDLVARIQELSQQLTHEAAEKRKAMMALSRTLEDGNIDQQGQTIWQHIQASEVFQRLSKRIEAMEKMRVIERRQALDQILFYRNQLQTKNKAA